MRVTIALAAGCLMIASLLAAESEAAIKRYELNIPRQALDAALKDLAQQTGLQVGRFSDAVNGDGLVGPLAGQYTTAQALRKLLEDSGLVYRELNDRAIIVLRPEDVAYLLPAPGGNKESAAKLQEGWQGAISGASLPGEALPLQATRLAPGMRMARSGAGEESDGAGARDGASSSTELREVVVTAQKREQRLQDVPISMQVLTAEQIDRRGLVSSEDYLRGIPGVNQMESGVLGQTIIIRGLETATHHHNFTQGGGTVASYFGETPTTASGGLHGSTSLDIKLVDIERVEVLRGPQGTAFGSSSMGGAVRTIPVAPKLDRFETNVAAGYSVTSGTGGSNHNYQGVLNLPVVQGKFALRALGYRYDESGFYRNRAGSDPAFQAAIAPFGADGFDVDEEEAGGRVFTGGRIAALFQPSDALRITLNYLKQETEMDGFGGSTSGTYDQNVLQIAPEHARRGSGAYFDTDIDLANAVLEYDLGWANLLGSYSYTKSASVFGFAFSSVLFPWPASEYGPSDHRAHVGELRLTTRFDGPWNFLVGVYQEDFNDVANQYDVWHGDPAANFFAPGERFLAHLLDQRSLEQQAAFGDVSWEVRERLTLTGGFRVYNYDRTYDIDAVGPLYGDIHESRQADASGTSFRGNLSYKLGDEAMVYGGWAEGFRLGRPQLGFPSTFCDVDNDGLVDGTNIPIESSRRVNSDKVDSYELGGKFLWLDRRLAIDAAAFRMEWSEMPVPLGGGTTAICQIAAAGSPVVANIGAARSEGFELQTNFQATDAVRIDFGGSYIRARLREDVPTLGAVAGAKLPSSPELNANVGLEYRFRLAGLQPSLRAEAIYVGPFEADLSAPSVNSKAGDYVKVDLSARIPIRALSIDVFARNLTNEDAFTTRYLRTESPFFGTRLRPRMFGVQVRYDFK